MSGIERINLKTPLEYAQRVKHPSGSCECDPEEEVACEFHVSLSEHFNSAMRDSWRGSYFRTRGQARHAAICAPMHKMEPEDVIDEIRVSYPFDDKAAYDAGPNEGWDNTVAITLRVSDDMNYSTDTLYVRAWDLNPVLTRNQIVYGKFLKKRGQTYKIKITKGPYEDSIRDFIYHGTSIG